MILVNQILCKKCGDTPYSKHRHDFKSCKCGAVSVDGGMDYLRRVGNFEDWVDLSIQIPDRLNDKLLQAVEDDTKNTLGKVCNVARVLRDFGINISKGEQDGR